VHVRVCESVGSLVKSNRSRVCALSPG
jgi:hypothetical protein